MTTLLEHYEAWGAASEALHKRADEAGNIDLELAFRANAALAILVAKGYLDQVKELSE